MDLYGLIGYPLGHSFSARFFDEKFRREGIAASYRNFELPDIGDLMELLAEVPELRGLNVTIPYKQLIIPYLTSLSPQAKAIGAVNTVRIVHDSDNNVTGLEGYNTDAPAFARTLAPLLPLEAISALVLGTGGASKAVCAALEALGISYTLVSRTGGDGRLTYANLDDKIISRHRLIVNTTPLGMSPATDNCPPIPYGALTTDHICYDLIYNPEQTLFMKQAAERGATVKNGLDMLHLQALLAWKIWQS
ncbi:MAG: shikimate dehydrogenase [Muribaculaceae bacterium]|nr:shikimate dehydrogenase [Muribaculaceae bacterium]